LVGWLLTGGGVQWTTIFLPLVLLPLLLLTLGSTWILASLGVFLRDVGQLIGLLVQALFFFTPIFYTLESVPEPLRSLMSFNPLASVVTAMRDILLFGRVPDVGLLATATLGGTLLAVVGYAWFQATRRGFADVL
jgi:lipopolysaccharide transport system permease protein